MRPSFYGLSMSYLFLPSFVQAVTAHGPRATMWMLAFSYAAGAGCNDRRTAQALPDEPARTSPSEVQPVPPSAPPGVAMQIQLNSTPPGAMALVDGKEVGLTPITYTVYVNDRPIEFVFKLEGYKPASYSFVPKTSGEVHGRLVPSSTTVVDPKIPATP